MGPGGLNFRVRNGIGWGTPGIATRSTGRMRRHGWFVLRKVVRGIFAAHGSEGESDQADRAISTGQLHGSPRFHIRPIDVVVFHGS